ncbi:MAG TPA: hypothetical protein PK527_07740 [Smithellaceae bacterium]|nr:hypothetical protein [Smithellaceae bacterium]HQB93031.1 hypothetical protein [Smithellaceae bacterium]
MQSKIIFFENTFEAGSIDKAKIYHPAKLLHKFRRFIECSDWDERLLKYEKYVNWFSYGIIAASALIFLPVCISILAR